MYDSSKLPLWVTVIVISLFGIFFSIYSIFSLNEIGALNAAIVIMFVVFGIFAVISCLVSGYNIYNIMCEKKYRKQNIERMQKEQELAAIKKAKIDFYQKCIDNGISKVNDDNKTDFMIVAKNAGIDDYNTALEYFNFGVEQDDMRMRAAETRKLNKEKQIVEQYYQQALEISEVIGKQKYINALDKSLTDYKLVSGTLDLAYSVGRTNAAVNSSNAKGADPYIIGGMATSIGGAAAGVTAYADTQRKNQEREERNRQSASLIAQENKQVLSEKKKNDLKIEHIERIKNTISNVLIDDSMSAEKFSSIIFKVIKYSYLRSGNLSIHISATPINENVMLLNKPAILDGSFKVFVCCDGIRIGETIAFVNLPDNLDSNNIGYGSEESKNIVVYCKPYNGKQFDLNKKYTFEFEDIHTWSIQKW